MSKKKIVRIEIDLQLEVFEEIAKRLETKDGLVDFILGNCFGGYPLALLNERIITISEK